MANSELKRANLNVEVFTAPIRRQVIKAIYDAISSGALKPGQRLVERDLCELMGVSRPPVREALRHLESEGLVVSIPKRGPIVAELSRDDVVHIYQVRGALEALAARLFAENASDEQLIKLEEAVTELATAMREKEIDRIIEVKDRFYSILSDGSGNPLVSSMLRSMKARIQILRRMSLSSPERSPNTLLEIEAILAAIKQRDGEAAFKESWDHIHNAADTAIAMLGAIAKDEDDNAADISPN